jgi:hypothetical protein
MEARLMEKPEEIFSMQKDTKTLKTHLFPSKVEIIFNRYQDIDRVVGFAGIKDNASIMDLRLCRYNRFWAYLDILNVVRHECVFNKVRVTARKMRVGPSEPAYRSRLQTTLSCAGKEPG